jgi:glycosyltransferase involved in cell wall biosynthesis
VPRVTVIIPTYNWATVLPYSIGSVLDQSFTDFELLVIGDGCTDESGEVVAAIDDPRVSWWNLETNAGHQSGPNNVGIERANGDVIAYLGHDDLWLPNHLELLVEAIDGGAPIAFSSILLVLLDDRPQRWPTAGASRRPGKWVPPSALAHRRDVAQSVGGWRHPFDSDSRLPEADLVDRMAQAWGPATFVDRVTAVKLSAGKRPNVYRDRPCHEQAHWLATIRASDDTDALVAQVRHERYIYGRDRTVFERARDWRAVRRVGSPVKSMMRRLHVLPPTRSRRPLTFEEQWREYRVQKGLDPDR